MQIPTQRWALEPWEGEDLPGLAMTVVPQAQVLREGEPVMCGAGHRGSPAADGWHGVWVNCLPAASCGHSGSRPRLSKRLLRLARRVGRGDLRPPAGCERRDAERFFDVFAWREPGQVAFSRRRSGPDRIKPTQLRFVEMALRFHRLEEFMIIEVAAPFLHTVATRGLRNSR